MSARADLTGQQIETPSGAWHVIAKAPAQNRKPFWTVEHACADGERRTVDLAHTLLVGLVAGKRGATLPPCVACTPSEELPAISHGLHLECGQAHLVGTPCGKAGPGECQHGYGWQTCPACTPGSFLEGVSYAQATGQPAPGAYVRTEAEKSAAYDAIIGPIAALDLDGWPSEPDDVEAPVELDLDALAAEPLPPILHLDLAAFAEPSGCPTCSFPVRETVGLVCQTCGTDYGIEPFGTDRTANAWSITDDKAPPAELNREFRDVLLAPMYKAMAGHERNSQVKPGPSGVGGCRRRLAHQLLYADEFEPAPSGWAAMKGTVLHAWYDSLIDQPGWFSDLALPQSVQSIAGGTLDLYVQRRIVDLKAPGTSTMKEARAGRLSNGYYVQTQVYGYGAEQLGLVVEKVGLLFVPMCGDNLDDAIYWEWPYDRAVAVAALADAERIVALGKEKHRAEVLAEMPTRSDFCSSCPAFGKHCAGAMAPAMRALPSGGLELVR